jgi:hypothetical protein
MRFFLPFFVFCSFSFGAWAYETLFTKSKFLKDSGQLIKAADVTYKYGEELDQAKKEIARNGCNHFMFLPMEYSHLVDTIGVGQLDKKYTSMDASLIGIDGNFYELAGMEKKSSLWQRLNFRHRPAVGRFVLFGDTKGVDWNPAELDITFKTSCVNPSDNLLLKRPSKEWIKQEKWDPKKIGNISEKSIEYYKVDGIKERVYYAQFELYGLGYIYQVGLVSQNGDNCTILNETQRDLSEGVSRYLGGANAKEFVGLMELGDKEKWLVFEAEGYEWWGYTTIPYNSGKPVKSEMIETVFYDGL